MSSATASPDVVIRTEIRGAPARLFRQRPREAVISGPAGTGKTRAILEFLHEQASSHQMRILILRKTHESLRQSTMVTFTQQVLHNFDGKASPLDGVTYHGGGGTRPAQFMYHNGSVIVTGGMDKVEKVLSTEWDIVYINECTELSLEEWETILTRTDRPSLDDKPPSMVLGDCNPNVPTHWILNRAKEGDLYLWQSLHEDNPAMWNRKLKAWTESGQRYLDRLENLTGVRYQRLRLGNWVAAEGQVFETWSDGRHMVNRFDVPGDWPRYWCLDFGFRNPTVWQWWTRSPDGDLYRYREIYYTQRLVEDHARLGMELSRDEPKPTAIIVDHDAEDRATFERHTGYRTVAATKNVSAGIQAVAERLGKDGTKPRIFFMRDSLVERDPELKEAGLPTCTEEEFPSYVWNLNANRKKGEEPVKENDHGCFIAGTLVATADGDRPIESIRKGDLVWTRDGLRPVVAAGMTSARANVYTAEMSDGRSITGTGNHPVWVDGKGWVRMDSMRYHDIIRTWKNERLSSTESDLTTTLSHDTGLSVSTLCHTLGTALRGLGGFTKKFGSLSMARFPRGMKFTTQTSPQRITRCRTSFASRHLSIKIFTESVHRSVRRARSIRRILNVYDRWQQRGIARLKASNGIGDMARGFLPQCLSRSLPASSVEMFSRLRSRTGKHDSAQINARPRIAMPAALMMNLALASTVAVNSPQTNTPQRSTATAHVLSVTAETKKQPVYNLTVKDTPEYFANGVLVHNCDATRYMVAHFDVSKRRGFGVA